MYSDAKPPQQSLQNARKEVTFHRLVYCHPQDHLQEDLNILHRLAIHNLTYPALVSGYPLGEVINEVLHVCLRAQLFKTMVEEPLHILSGRIHLSQWEGQFQSYQICKSVEGCSYCRVLRGEGCGVLRHNVHVPHEFSCSGLEVCIHGP